MSLPEGMTPQSHPRTVISSRKVIVSIFWSSFGFPVITALLPRTKLTAAYFCSGISPKIIV
jgi:hypothetical protein